MQEQTFTSAGQRRDYPLSIALKCSIRLCDTGQQDCQPSVSACVHDSHMHQATASNRRHPFCSDHGQLSPHLRLRHRHSLAAPVTNPCSHSAGQEDAHMLHQACHDLQLLHAASILQLSHQPVQPGHPVCQQLHLSAASCTYSSGIDAPQGGCQPPVWAPRLQLVVHCAEPGTHSVWDRSGRQGGDLLLVSGPICSLVTSHIIQLPAAASHGCFLHRAAGSSQGQLCLSADSRAASCTCCSGAGLAKPATPALQLLAPSGCLARVHRLPPAAPECCSPYKSQAGTLTDVQTGNEFAAHN